MDINMKVKLDIWVSSDSDPDSGHVHFFTSKRMDKDTENWYRGRGNMKVGEAVVDLTDYYATCADSKAQTLKARESDLRKLLEDVQRQISEEA